MRLIEHVKLSNFRSIESISIEARELTAFIGTNGSGKSNVLRALNLFFNGAVEGGVGLDLRRDFHKPWRSRETALSRWKWDSRSRQCSRSRRD
jgi:predicted ATP-dependent endonuclease of OLD family